MGHVHKLNKSYKKRYLAAYTVYNLINYYGCYFLSHHHSNSACGRVKVKVITLVKDFYYKLIKYN